MAKNPMGISAGSVARLRSVKLGWFHRYPARFPPGTVERMVRASQRRCGKPQITILDAFAGTGSTLSTARQLGHHSIGIELTHLGVLISRLRLAPPKDIPFLLDFVDGVCGVDARSWAAPVDDGLVNWVGIRNGKVLSHFLMLLQLVDDPLERSWLELAMSSALRSSSVWLPGSIKPQIDPDRSPPCLRRSFRRAARRLARDCLLEASASAKVSATIIKGSATDLPIPDAAVDAIVSSPPYSTMYDYFDVQRLSYLAFAWPRENNIQIGRVRGVAVDGVGFLPPDAMVDWYIDRFRGEDTAKGRSLRAYLSALEKHFVEAFRVIKPGGSAAYAVANSIRLGIEFPLVDAITQLMKRAGFEDVKALRRQRSSRAILPGGRSRVTGRFSSRPGVELDERVIYALRP